MTIALKFRQANALEHHRGKQHTHEIGSVLLANACLLDSRKRDNVIMGIAGLILLTLSAGYSGLGVVAAP